MEQLKVIGTEDGRLVLATERGETFSLPIDETLRAEVRRGTRASEDVSASRTPRPSPREVQAHIRAGLSASEVASMLGAQLEDVIRFEAPILAEREHIVGLALAVPVLLGAVDDADAQPTFGAAIRAKLAEAGASGERWTSWKEDSGWLVKLEFRVGDVDHDARWTFEPRRSALAPINSDATQLSRQGSLPEGLIPRLRALDNNVLKDETRFDSGAFGPRHDSEPEADLTAPELAQSVSPAVSDAAIKRSTEASRTSSETADLLEALRRRRGQREPAPGADAEQTDTARAQAPVALFDALEPGYDESGTQDDAPTDAAQPNPEGTSRRRGRAALPSWDEIVFGARGDNE